MGATWFDFPQLKPRFVMKSNHLEKVQERSLLVEAASKLTWLDRVTAAAYMGIGTTYLDMLIKQHSLPASKVGGRVIVQRQDIDHYLKQCTPQFHKKF